MSTPLDLVVFGRQPPSERLSFEEFLAWCDGETLAEWVDGEVRSMSPTSRRDQRLLIFLTQVLGIWIDQKGLGELHVETFLMRLPHRPSGRVPDLLFVAREHLDRIRPTYVDGPADLVIEIVSPDSDERDREEKLREYEQAGIPEYWLLDPLYQRADFYQLGPDGRYRLVLGGRSGVYHSRALGGLRLDIEWLWQDPLPNALDLLRRLGLLPD
ncbi:MAG: Uma2 family endonuclease [Chloroflexi bacterium]|nr:Uma2 family endonuclease [Chloroflexota bacterium]